MNKENEPGIPDINFIVFNEYGQTYAVDNGNIKE